SSWHRIDRRMSASREGIAFLLLRDCVCNCGGERRHQASVVTVAEGQGGLPCMT
ncbi:MAG: hypothetical protein JWO13_3893, partial [Acidobacteriales bacterium]|nr:hypothetical protein [Terriglobales bacterium]